MKQPLPVVSSETGELVDCWNQIGVMGDGSCAKLAEVVHCRNCQVYSAARAQLLDRQLPQDYRREWTEHFSKAKTSAAPGKNSVVIFRIGTEWLALSTHVFQEVAERRPIHSLPHRRNGILLGLTAIRGELLICVSLEGLLGIRQEDDSQKAGQSTERLMVTEWEGNLLTFPVNEIHGIHRYHQDELKSIPATVANAATSFTQGIFNWQNQTVGCLDETKLFQALNRSLA